MFEISKNSSASEQKLLTTSGIVFKFNTVAIKIDLGTSLQSLSDTVLLETYRILEFIQPLVYEIKNDSSGEIHAIVDASNFSAEFLQSQIRSIGSNQTGYNFQNAVVTMDSSLTVV